MEKRRLTEAEQLKIIDALKRENEYLRNQLNGTFSAFALGDAIDDGICVADANRVVIAINSSYTKITDIPEEEILGKSLLQMKNEGYFTDIATDEVLRTGKRYSTMTTITRNGKQVLLSGVPVKDEEGNVYCVMTVMRDLTELLNLREELETVAIENERYIHEISRLRHRGESGLLGEHPDMIRLHDLINYVAKTDVTVLIQAETGCGKEVVANEIQKLSARRDKPYIKVNCAAIPDTLIESELFGYEAGAFTGAQPKGKPGMFELANGGTILLDEIGELPLAVQSKLLRVLQEKEIQRLGGGKSVPVDVRVIASTNRDLKTQVEQKSFRQDLYYRLNVVPMRVPPLRDRKNDIPLLADAFLKQYNEKYHKNKRFGTGAVYAMTKYDWPGNVRELENTIERVVVISDNIYITNELIEQMLSVDSGPVTGGGAGDYSGMSLDEATRALQKELISNALDAHGSTYKAAQALGMSQPTLFRKAKALGLMERETTK
ncbi:MAG: sigma 54-interacting transcriptional regulator [Oscillospiraceae bacterium]|nr:sigma 54-interacting transcriptional regulator [Oscillospiraceae bacterium]